MLPLLGTATLLVLVLGYELYSNYKSKKAEDVLHGLNREFHVFSSMVQKHGLKKKKRL